MALLNPQSIIPALSLPTVTGRTVGLLDDMPDNFRILIAYRGVHCPKCKAQLEDVNTRMADLLADGHDLMAFSMDSEERAKRAKSEWDIPEVPVAYNLGLLDAKSLGLFISDSISEAEPRHFSEPGLFVIRNDGSLYAQIIQNTPFGRPDMSDLLAGLNFAVKNDYPVRGTSTA